MYYKQRERDMMHDICTKGVHHLHDIMAKDDLTPMEIDAAKDLAKMIHYVGEENKANNGNSYHANGHNAAPMAANGEYEHEEWGDANPEARRLFEALEKHYMGFWKAAADFGRTRSVADKHRMLEHFKNQLTAHDEIAAFVKDNCPEACPEIGQILMAWKAKK